MYAYIFVIDMHNSLGANRECRLHAPEMILPQHILPQSPPTIQTTIVPTAEAVTKRIGGTKILGWTGTMIRTGRRVTRTVGGADTALIA